MSIRRIRHGAIIATLALFAALPAAAVAKKTITISGSTSVHPIAVKQAKAFVKTKKGKNFAFRILQGGSNVGIADIAAGRVSAGLSSRDPAPGDPAGLVFTKVNKDALCIATNTANKLTNITTAQVQGIFKGPTVAINNWSAIPGATVGGAITPIGRAPTSGTHDAFRTIYLGGVNQAPNVAGKASNGLVQQGVQADPSAIGYVSFAFLKGLNSVAYNGVECNLRNAKSGAFGGTRNFWVVTQGVPVGPVKKFIKFWLSKKGDKITATSWVPL